MILRVTRAEVIGPHQLWLAFNDGTAGQADLRTVLDGQVFEPLLDPAYFARAELDPECGTVAWPNGADLAPEALRALVGAGVAVG